MSHIDHTSSEVSLADTYLNLESVFFEFHSESPAGTIVSRTARAQLCRRKGAKETAKQENKDFCTSANFLFDLYFTMRRLSLQ